MHTPRVRAATAEMGYYIVSIWYTYGRVTRKSGVSETILA